MLRRSRWALASGLVLATWVTGGCTDEVFIEAEPFEQPPAAAAGFLGYADQDDKRPVCGNCHIGKSGKWENTAHANAWADLQASGHASESCEGCHTVGARGNAVEDEIVGWAATGDPRYHDVQCENCHGPGLDHVTNPDATQPLAPVSVGVDLTFGCGECHQGAHNPFVEEWSQSAHGNPNPYPQGRDACQGCHEGQAALRALGVNAEYVEKGSDELLPIACAVCHDPHDATNEKQLRFPVGAANIEQNLCMKCHQKRAVPEPGSPRGPHSPQGPLLLGEDVGWIPPNFQYDETRIRSTHGTERNERLCAGCHVNRLEVTDPVTGDFVINATGHLFKAIPCLDESGAPTPGEDCSLSERSFASCTTSGCHGSEAAARSAYIVAQERVTALVAELEALIEQVPDSEFDADDDVFTTAEGARFNAQLGAISSSAIHNPFLTEALLTASIRQVEQDYGLQAAAGLRLDDVLSLGR